MKTQLGPPAFGFTLVIERQHGQYVLSERDDYSPHQERSISMSPNEAMALVTYLTEKLEKHNGFLFKNMKDKR